MLKSIVIFILTLEARLVLKKRRPRVVAVTGSVGKTAAKDALVAALGAKYRVRGSEKSFNSELGVPLTVLGLKNAWHDPLLWLRNMCEGAFTAIASGSYYPELLVLEAGVDRPGDMRRLASWLAPDVVVLTRFPDVPVHVEFFESPEAVIEEKRFLKLALRANGTLIINADDPKMAEEKIAPGQKIISFGFGDRAIVRGTFPEIRYENGRPLGMGMKIEYAGKSMPFFLPGALGAHHLYPVLAAFAAGILEDIPPLTLLEALRTYRPPKGRMHLLSGKNGTTLIDDSYNASPEAVHAALETLRTLTVPEGTRKIVVLGDMMELGSFSAQEHRRAGKAVAESADIFVAVGLRMKEAAAVAHASGIAESLIYSTKDSTEAGEYLASRVREGDVILLKGSQSMRMERATKILLADPLQAEILLVRQEKEWMNR